MTKNDQSALDLLRKMVLLHQKNNAFAEERDRLRAEMVKVQQGNGSIALPNPILKDWNELNVQQYEHDVEIEKHFELAEAWTRGEDIILAKLAQQ